MRAALLATLLLLVGCASAPPRMPRDGALGDRIAAGALAQIGRPYRFGGDGPDAFDCSGLCISHDRRASTAAHREHLPLRAR